MSKAVLISIHPEWCSQIENGLKTIEIRKTRPKISAPFKCYIYCASSFGGSYIGLRKVIGEFVCDDIIVDLKGENADIFEKQGRVSLADQKKYRDNKPLYGWHISDLVIYDKPKELSEFFVIDKRAVKECSFRERIYTNPDYTNGVCLPGTYICNKDPVDIDFCRGGCWKKSLSRPPQSWCYVEYLK